MRREPHPRPQLERERWLDLDGDWEYAVTPRTTPAPAAFDGEIRVPFCIESRASGVGRRLEPGDRLWYRRTVELEPGEERWLLHFGAVDQRCVLWVNDALVGAHEGGFDAFSFDVTDWLRAGENRFLVAVDDDTSRSDAARGKQHLKPNGIWYTPVTGIWQSVWLEPVPRAAHIDEVRIDADARTGHVEVRVHLARPTREATLAVEVSLSVDGLPVGRCVGRPDRRLHLSIERPQLWSPESPVLHDVEVRLLRVPDVLAGTPAQDGLARALPLRGPAEAERFAAIDTATATEVDRVSTRVGIRSIEVGPDPRSGRPALLLNGAPRFMLGTLDQGWWPEGLHTPPSNAALRADLEFLKAAGFDTVRKHIKIEPARFYRHCDELGLLVWQDVPSGFLPAQWVAPNDDDEDVRRPASVERYEFDLQRMIHRLAPFAAIVVWVIHNEGWGQFDTERLTRRVRDLDPSRLVDAVSGWRDQGAGDVLDVHDYAETPVTPAIDDGRVPVIGEYGGIGWPVEGHLWDPEARNWGYRTHHDRDSLRAAYAHTFAAIAEGVRSRGLGAAIYTQTTDVETEVNGLLTYDRAVDKLGADWLAALHATLDDARDR